MALINIEEATGVVMEAARSRWPDSRIDGGIRPQFWKRIDQRIIYAIAEEVARTRKDGLIART